MKKQIFLVLTVLMVVILFICGCTGRYDANYNILNNDATLTIKDFDDKPLRLYVGGSNNNITISRNVELKSVIIEGMDNIVRISHLHVNYTTDVHKNTNSKVVFYD